MPNINVRLAYSSIDDIVKSKSHRYHDIVNRYIGIYSSLPDYIRKCFPKIVFIENDFLHFSNFESKYVTDIYLSHVITPLLYCDENYNSYELSKLIKPYYLEKHYLDSITLDNIDKHLLSIPHISFYNKIKIKGMFVNLLEFKETFPIMSECEFICRYKKNILENYENIDTEAVRLKVEEDLDKKFKGVYV